MKQTAVEWLHCQLDELEMGKDRMTKVLYLDLRDEIFKLANEIEKQQIVDAVDGHPIQNRNLDGEQYYIETYGK